MRLDSNLPTRLDFPEPVPPAIPITIIDLLSVLNRFFVLQGIIGCQPRYHANKIFVTNWECERYSALGVLLWSQSFCTFLLSRCARISERKQYALHFESIRQVRGLWHQRLVLYLRTTTLGNALGLFSPHYLKSVAGSAAHSFRTASNPLKVHMT